MLLWFVAAGGALTAIVALLIARHLRRRLEHLTQSYWELKYEYTKLRSELARLDPNAPALADPPGAPDTAFVPLSTLKK